ncbi:unnamed protein product [Urochloa humidicola]
MLRPPASSSSSAVARRRRGRRGESARRGRRAWGGRTRARLQLLLHRTSALLLASCSIPTARRRPGHRLLDLAPSRSYNVAAQAELRRRRGPRGLRGCVLASPMPQVSSAAGGCCLADAAGGG